MKRRNHRESRRGFTLIELLVVIAVILILLALSLPALSRAKDRARAMHCLNNLRQLGLGWQMYTGDYGERVTPNCSLHDGNEPGNRYNTWVEGWLSADQFVPDNTNTLFLTQSHLWPYHEQLAIWRCPADSSRTVLPGGSSVPRVRSMSMNKWLNCPRPWHDGSGGERFRLIRRTTDLTYPAPAMTWVFTDERPDSINDGHFVVDMDGVGPLARMVDFPASAHHRAGGFYFADGHVELKRWLDARTLPTLEPDKNLELDIESPGNPDVAWLQARTTGAW